MKIKNYKLFTESINEKTFIAEFEDEKGKKTTKEFQGEKLEDVTIEATNYAEDNDLELLGVDEKVEEDKTYENEENKPGNYFIVVPTEEDRKILMGAFEHIHYSDIDTEIRAVNQLAHEYLDNTIAEGTKNNIVVNEEIFNKLKDSNA